MRPLAAASLCRGGCWFCEASDVVGCVAACGWPTVQAAQGSRPRGLESLAIGSGRGGVQCSCSDAAEELSVVHDVIVVGAGTRAEAV